MKFLDKYEKYAGFILRVGLGFVFVYFGIWKFVSPESWATYVAPVIAKFLPFSTVTLMYVMGVLETVVGVMLIIGIFTQVAALLASLQLLAIVTTTGWSDIVVRDIGLLLASLALTLRPRCSFSADNLRKK